MTRTNQGLSSLAPWDVKRRDPGNEVGPSFDNNDVITTSHDVINIFADLKGNIFVRIMSPFILVKDPPSQKTKKRKITQIIAGLI